MFFESAIGEKDRVAVLGHVRPDGDAVGACLAVKNYPAQARPSAEVTVYMEKFHPSFYMLPGARDVRFDFPDRIHLPLCLFLGRIVQPEPPPATP